MNKRKVLQNLLQELDGFYKNKQYIFHKEFVVELGEILTNNAVGSEKIVMNLFMKQMYFIQELSTNINRADSNEILKDFDIAQDYYSLHLQNKTVNIRIIMTFSKGNVPMFLAAFFEREGKRNTDYSSWKEIVKKRYQQLKGENYE